MEQLQVFVHIPKTGGTSFRKSVIEQNIPRQRWFHYRGLRDFFLRSQKGHDIVIGHLPYGLHLLTGRSCLYYTILRDPLDHAISMYHFIRQNNYDTYQHPRLETAQRYSLVEYTRKNRNMQCRYIAGFPWNRIYAKDSRRLLDTARRHLFGKFKHYGVLDYLDQFEAQIAASFGWDHQPVYEQTKKTWKRPKVADLADEEIAQLQDILSLDIELYNEAKKRIEQVGAGK